MFFAKQLFEAISLVLGVWGRSAGICWKWYSIDLCFDACAVFTETKFITGALD